LRKTRGSSIHLVASRVFWRAIAIADGENRYGMTFAAIALGTAGAMPDDSLEQGAAEDVLGAGEARGEAIAFTKSGFLIHY
jgi:hypothetical protein